MAARWRVPRVLLISMRRVSGKIQAAYMIRSPRTTTPPSCMGELGKKMEFNISEVSALSTRTPLPVSWWISTERSMAMMPPVRCRANWSVACTTASTSNGLSSSEEKMGRLPNSARSRRSSGWKMMRMATVVNRNNCWSNHRSTCNSNKAMSVVMPIRMRKPSTTGQPRERCRKVKI